MRVLEVRPGTLDGHTLGLTADGYQCGKGIKSVIDAARPGALLADPGRGASLSYQAAAMSSARSSSLSTANPRATNQLHMFRQSR